MGLIKNNKSLRMSAPTVKTLYGVQIRKLPIIKYIQVMRAADELPQLIIGKAFPGSSITDVMTYLKTLNKDKLLDLVTRLLGVVPEELMKLLSQLLDIPEERLLSDREDALSPTEILKIVSAFWDVNDMSDFFTTARQLTGKMKTTSTGFSGGSPLGRV